MDSSSKKSQLLMVFKGGATVGAGQILSQALLFARNVIIARLISPKDFGIAATFALTISIFEMMSNLSVDKLLIQAKDGDETAFQNTAQLIQAGRGLMNASFIFLLGRPIADLFGVPQARWAFELLAVVPLLRGFIHLDTSRLQREMHFRPAVTVDVSAQIVVTAASLPLAFWLRDYTAMLWVLILKTVSETVVSHLVSERPYGWARDKNYARRIASFGWPLLINGLLLFIIMDGDRFIIGSAHRLFPASTLSLADLGVYSVAFALTMSPAILVTNICSSIFLPLLSRVQGQREQFEMRYTACNQFLATVAAGIAIPFVLLGGWFVVLIYGAKYAMASHFIAWLAVMWSLRVIRTGPTMAAVALGDTRNSMYSNIARTIALAGVLTAAAVGADLVWIAISGFVGELLALVVCVGRLHHEHGVRASSLAKPLAIYAGSVVAAGVAVAWGLQGLGPAASLLGTVMLVLLVCAAMLMAFPTLRAQVGGLILRSPLLFGQ